MAEKKKTAVKKVKTALDILKPEHRLFVVEYVANCGNAVEAYLKVYPKTKYNSARALSSKLLTNINVSEAIEIEAEKYWKEKDKNIEKSKTYRLINYCGDVDIEDIFDDDYDIKPLSQISTASKKAIQNIRKIERPTKYGIETRVEVDLVPKLQALELRAKIQKMLDNKLDVGDITITVIPAIEPDSVKDDD